MKKYPAAILSAAILLGATISGRLPAQSTPRPSKDSGALLPTMQAEMERAKAALAKSDPAPYFISYEVYDQRNMVVTGTYGTIVNSNASTQRWADVTMRVGTPAMDNTHAENRPSGMSSGPLPLADDRDAIARTLWELTNREYRRASPAFAKVMTNTAVQAAEEDKSPDFSKEPPQTEIDAPAAPVAFHQKEWEEKIRKYSGAFRKYPDIYTSSVTLQIEQTTS